jgi:hypothetical protein
MHNYYLKDPTLSNQTLDNTRHIILLVILDSRQLAEGRSHINLVSKETQLVHARRILIKRDNGKNF